MSINAQVNIFQNVLAAGSKVKVTDVSYYRGERRWSHPGVDEQFEAIIDSDKFNFEARLKNLNYSDVEIERHRPDSWLANIYVSVRDGFGNIEELDVQENVIFPVESKVGQAIAVGCFSTVIALFVLVGAAVVVPLLAASLPVPLSAKKRLGAYFLFINYYPYVRRFASPSWDWSRRLLRRIYVKLRCNKPTRPQSAHHLKVLGRLNKSRRLITLTPDDVGAGVSLDSLADEVLCCEVARFSEALPVRVRFENSSPQVDKGQIKGDVITTLKQEFQQGQDSGDEFYNHMLNSFEFLFLFSVDSENSALLRAIDGFRDVEGRNSWFILQDAVEARETQPSEPSPEESSGDPVARQARPSETSSKDSSSSGDSADGGGG